jgi:uncharacterized membrane protein
MQQDAAFGFRQIVDIAEKSLSPGINDPTTAVQAIDQLHTLLRLLAGRRMPSEFRCDAEGNLRLILPALRWDDYLRLAVDEIRHYGNGSIQVLRRLRYLLDDVLANAPPGRTGVVREQLDLLDAAVSEGLTTETEKKIARIASRQSHGGPARNQVARLLELGAAVEAERAHGDYN